MQTLPSDGATVWIRVYWWDGLPVLATFDRGSWIFRIDWSGMDVPAWAVARWREQ